MCQHGATIEKRTVIIVTIEPAMNSIRPCLVRVEVLHRELVDEPS
eukprot:COSAG06_NODE_35862_length_454_cov_4.414085_2_plen_44_part_01